MLNTPTSLTKMPSISINDFIDIMYFQLLIPEIRTLAKFAKWLDYKLQKRMLSFYVIHACISLIPINKITPDVIGM